MATKLDIIAYEARYGRRPYWLSLLIAVDQLVNAALWGFVDETLSSRAHRCAERKRRWAVAERVIDAIFFWDRHGPMRHCELAYLAELMREHSPIKRLMEV